MSFETQPNLDKSNLSLDDITLRLQRDVYAYVRLTEDVAERLSAFGIQVRPYDMACLHFARLPAPQRGIVLSSLRTFISATNDVQRSGWDLRDDRKFLWAMIKRTGLHPPSDLFEHLQDEDVIEIIDAKSQIQIFRNIRYFYVCSYTLDDLLSRPWFELFRRDPMVTESLMATVAAMMSSNDKRIFAYNAGVHVLAEVASQKQNTCVLENRFIAPLYDRNGTLCAAVNVTRLISCTPRHDQ